MNRLRVSRGNVDISVVALAEHEVLAVGRVLNAGVASVRIAVVKVLLQHRAGGGVEDFDGSVGGFLTAVLKSVLTASN